MDTPDPVSVELTGLQDLVRWRAVVREAAASAGFLPGGVDDAALVASEIATNALVHGTQPVLAEVELCATGLSIRVGDGSDRLPVLVAEMPGTAEIGGRGIPIVLALAASFEVLQHPTGKTVVARMGGEGQPRGADNP